MPATAESTTRATKHCRAGSPHSPTRSGTRDRQQQGVDEFDFAPIVPEQWSKAAANAEVDPSAGILRIDSHHVIPLLVRHHLERQFVVIAQKYRPLAARWNGRRLFHDIHD